MASRYQNSKVIKDKNGKRKLSTIILPVEPMSESDTFILTTGLERLDKLAFDFYDDASLWWIIAEANQLGKGTLMIPASTRLRIPPKGNIQDLISDENKER
jgi:hypothetical protein